MVGHGAASTVERVDLRDPGLVPAAAEGRVEKGADDLSARRAPIRPPPSVSRLALLCSRALRAVVTSWHMAARTPATLLATMQLPMPAPSTMIPNSAAPADTDRATARAKSG